MTTRRTFIEAALVVAAASAAGLPRLAHAEVRPKTAPKTARIKAKDGTELFVKDTGGTGRVALMTHAWPLTADIWDYQAAELSKGGFRVVTYDRRGFGRSGQPAGGYDFDVFADDLSAVIQHTGVSDVTLVGYSMGGGEVVRYFSRHKGRKVAKAALVAGAACYLLKTADNPAGIDRAVFDGIRQGVQGDRETYLRGLLRDVFLDAKRPAANPVTQEMVDALLVMAMQASVAATVACVDAFSATDFRSELAAVNVPTIVLHGTADIPVPFVMGQATAAGIAQSRLIEYQDASHGIVVTERERVTRDLQALLAM